MDRRRICVFPGCAGRTDSGAQSSGPSGDRRGLIACSADDAPEIDGVVFVNGVSSANVGDFLEFEIIASDEHDPYA